MKCIKKITTFILFILFSISSFASVVTDNDGAVFITKGEFDKLRNYFSNQINEYNISLDNKIEGAIASYLIGIKLPTIEDVTPVFPGRTVTSYGLSNELMFKAGISSAKGLIASGNAHGDTNTPLYATTYGWFDFTIPKKNGIFKVVKRKLNSDMTYATEWLGTSNDLEMGYIGYLRDYDTQGSNKQWTETNAADVKDVLFFPSTCWSLQSGGANVELKNAYNTSGTWHSIYGNGNWFIQFGSKTDAAKYYFWTLSEYTKAIDTSQKFHHMNYGTLTNNNIILTNNNMAEDFFFNNTEDVGSVNNYNQMPGYGNTITKTFMDSEVSKGRILSVNSTNYNSSISVTTMLSAREKTTKLEIYNTDIHAGVRNDTSTKHTLSAGGDRWSAWPNVTTSTNYFFWPQKGWDPNVKYEQLYCSELQDEELNNMLDGSEMLKTAEIDGKNKLTAYAGLALANIKENIVGIYIPINFTDSSEYDMWIKWGPFTNKENPKLESDLFKNMTVKSPHTIDSTTKGVKVKNGDYLKIGILGDTKGYIFIKWSKHQTDTSKIGTGGGSLVVPTALQVAKAQ